MARVSFEVPAGMRNVLAAMPTRAKATFSEGLRTLSTLDETSRRKVFDAFLALLPEITDIDTPQLVRETGIDEELGPIMLVLVATSISFATSTSVVARNSSPQYITS